MICKGIVERYEPIWTEGVIEVYILLVFSFHFDQLHAKASQVLICSPRDFRQSNKKSLNTRTSSKISYLGAPTSAIFSPNQIVRRFSI